AAPRFNEIKGMIYSSNQPGKANPSGAGNGTASSLDLALAYHRAGFSVIPIKTDGSKSPALISWKRFTEEMPSEAMIREFFANGPRGLAIICGTVSGNLETIDFDRGDLFGPWCELVEVQAPGLVARLCVVQTPREPAGYHVRYRCSAVNIPGNTK